MQFPVPDTAPQPVAPDTWLIPNLAPAGEGLFIPVNSMVIRGAEPVIVDTGAPVHRELWLEKVFSIVEPKDDSLASPLAPVARPSPLSPPRGRRRGTRPGRRRLGPRPDHDR